MNAILSMGAGEWWQLAGWTMLHFLWLGSLVAAMALVSRLVLRRAPANVRFSVALVMFAVLAALPVGIAAWVGAEPRSEAALHVEAKTQAEGLSMSAARPVVAPDDATTTRPRHAEIEDSHKVALAEPSATAPIAVSFTPIDEPLAVFALDAAVKYLPWLWIVGTPLTFMLLATGVVGAERLRQASRTIQEGPIAEACARLANSLRIGRRVTVAVCERIAAPVLVGIVRPIVLLPPAALTGWSPEEIEMVLLHELAHVRRWDNLVNLVQRIVESVLFFHPAVWLLSSWVRREREACCDALVVGRTQRPQAYAEFLVSLAAQMPRSVLFHPAAASAMAARPLRGRIRRILGIDDDPMLVSGKSLAVVMSGLLLAATLAVLNLPTSGQAEESTTEVTNEKSFKPDREGLSEPEYLQPLFTASEQNPLQTRFYQAPPSLTRSLSLAFEGLVQDPFGPKVAFESRWDPVRGAFEISAPLKAHETFFNVYIPQAIAAEEKLGLTTEGTEGIGRGKKQESKAKDSEQIKWQRGFITRSMFVPSDENKLETRNYEISDSSRIVFDLDSLTGVLTADESEPRPVFGHNWSHEFTRLEVVAPQKGQEFIAKLIHDSATAGQKNRTTEDTESTEKKSERRASRPSMGFAVFHGVPFEVGASRFAEGDAITITEIKGSSTTFEPGEIYQIHGTYTLTSCDRASLLASVTARIAEEGRSPTSANQTMSVERGSGTFMLELPMNVRGWPHVSFYPAEGGQSFGGVYFGTDESVLENWSEVYGSDDTRSADSGAKVGRGKFPSLDEQKLADLAWKRLGLELEPIGAEDLKRVRAMGYEGGVKVSNIQGHPGGMLPQDILVGLHVWPTKSLSAIVEVLSRDDLAELNPLKSYVVRPGAGPNQGGYSSRPEEDRLITGRILVQFPATGTSARTLTREEMGRLAIGEPGTAESVPQSTQYYSAPPLRRAVPGEPPPPINPADYGRVWPAVAPDAGRSEPQTNQPTKLRYDGRTFEEWRDAWRTELSTEKRLEAVKALAAFGASGHGKEAAEAIVEIAPQYGLSEWMRALGPSAHGTEQENRTPGQALLTEMIRVLSLGGSGQSPFLIPFDETLAALEIAARSEDVASRRFVALVLGFRSYNPKSEKVFMPLLIDEDESVRNWASEIYREVRARTEPRPSAKPAIDYLKQVIEEKKSPATVEIAKEVLAKLEEDAASDGDGTTD